MSKFWNSLSEKGKYSTIIGFITAAITTGLFVKDVIDSEAFKYLPYALGWSFSIIFFILPSWFKMKWGTGEIEIKD
jgi:hypothetical protein